MDEIDTIMQRLDFRIRESFDDGQARLSTDDTTLTRFEEAIGYQLPAEYRRFLARYGGACFHNVVADPASPDSRLSPDFVFHVNMFSGFYSDAPRRTVHDLSCGYRLWKDRLPPGLIPIAESCDNWYCLSCAGGAAYDHVYLRMPEEFDDDSPEDFTFLIAHSFMEFVRSLRKRTNEEVDKV
jgi:hypothetical protein